MDRHSHSQVVFAVKQGYHQQEPLCTWSKSCHLVPGSGEVVAVKVPRQGVPVDPGPILTMEFNRACCFHATAVFDWKLMSSRNGRSGLQPKHAVAVVCPTTTIISIISIVTNIITRFPKRTGFNPPTRNFVTHNLVTRIFVTHATRLRTSLSHTTVAHAALLHATLLHTTFSPHSLPPLNVSPQNVVTQNLSHTTLHVTYKFYMLGLSPSPFSCLPSASGSNDFH